MRLTERLRREVSRGRLGNQAVISPATEARVGPGGERLDTIHSTRSMTGCHSAANRQGVLPSGDSSYLGPTSPPWQVTRILLRSQS
jgi:hypothetical protein